MRGTHYGADYRWFARFVGDDVTIPRVEVDRDAVDELLSDRGLYPQRSLEDTSDPRGLHRVTGGEPSVFRDAVAARMGRSREPGGDPPGSLKAAMARARSAAARPAPEGGPRSAHGTVELRDRGGQDSLPPDVQRLADIIEQSVNPRELAPYAFEQLLAAFRAANLNPGMGSKLVQAWAHGKKMSPEEVVSAIKRAKNDWLAQAKQGPPAPPQLQVSAKEWDYDEAVADFLGQRDNVGRGPKDIDRERLMLLRRLMASFSGQANYGFTGADAAAEAVSSTGVLS